MPSIKKMVELAVWFCRDANTGYDQGNRWDLPKFPDTEYPGETDCSALTYECGILAGFDLPTSGTRYTGTIDRDFRRAGFLRIPFASIGGKDGLVPGDILYKDGHVAIWTGSAIAEAYIDENGGIRGGKAGDQANETRLSPYRGGWTYVYRHPDNDMLEPVEPHVWPNVEEGYEVGDIIATGTNGITHAFDQKEYSYRWIQYADGRLDCWISDWFGGGTGAKYKPTSGDTLEFYISKNPGLEFPQMHDEKCPAFIEPPMIPGWSVRASRNLLGITFNGIGTENASFWVSGPAQSIPKFYLDAKVEGFWK